MRKVLLLTLAYLLTFGFGIAAELNTVKSYHPKLVDRPVYWAGANAPTASDNQQIFGLVKAAFDSANPGDATELIEQFVAANPASGWTPALQNMLADHDFKHAQFTPALDLWKSVWVQTKDFPASADGKKVADFALANLTRLLASLGRTDQLTELFNETKNRTLDQGPLSAKLLRTKEGFADMKAHPGKSYRCGTLAIINVCRILYGTNCDYNSLLKIKSTTNGFTLNELSSISEKFNLNLVAAKLDQDSPLIVPSVVNWKQHHYGAIIAMDKDHYKVVDPTTENPRWLTSEEIKNEASGYYFTAIP